MKRPFLFVILLICVALTNIGGCNAFNDLYDKNTDEAIVVDVKKLINARLWNDAVLKWQTLSSTGQLVRENRVLFATALAGRGGLDLLELMTIISGGSGGTFFELLLDTFKGKTAENYQDQVDAANVLLGLSATAAGRSSDENVFMLFVQIAKLGSLMAFTGDLDGDGIVDPTYNNCALTVDQGNEAVTAIGNISDILSVIGTSMTGSTLDALTTACASLSGACAVTLTSGVDANMNRLGRTLIGESNLGVGLAAPYNNPYCQLSNSPIDPTMSAPPLSCPGGVTMGTGFACP